MLDQNTLWRQAHRLAELNYEIENGKDSWLYADKYEKEDWVWVEYTKLQKENEEMANMMRDKMGRFCTATENTNNVTNENNTYKKENETMTNTNTTNNVTRKSNKEIRMEVLASSGVDTSKFFNLSLSNIPHGTPVQVNIGGIMYDLTPCNVENNAEGWDHFDEVVKDILDNGFVFNRRTDGRFIVAQTFKMLNEKSYNHKLRQWEYGWDAYLRNRYGYMYQFEMMKDELKRLVRMERDNDPEFARLSRFFTKDVVIKTCEHYMKQLKKYVAELTADDKKLKKHEGKPYIHFNGIKGQDRRGNVHVKDLDTVVYLPLEARLASLKHYCITYFELYNVLCDFMKYMPELKFDTPKCGAFKDAFKAKGAYVTLLNLIKFHNVKVYGMDVYKSVDYIEKFAVEYKDELWRFHKLLKDVIAENNFDLKESIESQKK